MLVIHLLKSELCLGPLSPENLVQSTSIGWILDTLEKVLSLLFSLLLLLEHFQHIMVLPDLELFDTSLQRLRIVRAHELWLGLRQSLRRLRTTSGLVFDLLF
jgi:hypothetical protein